MNEFFVGAAILGVGLLALLSYEVRCLWNRVQRLGDSVDFNGNAIYRMDMVLRGKVESHPYKTLKRGIGYNDGKG